MASMVPETKFNTAISINVKPGRVFFGGLQWVLNRIYSSQEDKFVQFKEVIEIDLSDLDATVHTDLEHALLKEVFTFENDVKFLIAAYVNHVTDGYPRDSYDADVAAIMGVLKHNNTIYYPNGIGTPSFDYLGGEIGYSTTGSGSSREVKACQLNLVKEYGVKVALLTYYPDENAVQGVTNADNIRINVYVPNINSRYLDGFQSFQGVGSETLKFKQQADKVVTEQALQEWNSNPQWLYYNYWPNYEYGDFSLFNCNNLTSLKNKLDNISPLPGNPFINTDPDDPTQETDPSSPGGGGGTMDPTSDPIPFPDLPVGGALVSGAVQAFEVTPQALTQMFLKLWDTSIFDIATFQKLVEAPLDSLIQLQCVPIDPHTNGTGHIMLGNFDTEAVAARIDQEYYTVDCGTLKVEEYWGSALDYSPYTSAEIWVPMVGFRDVDINDIMGKTIHLKYNYSIFDGNLTAQLMCGNAVLYKWPGNVRETIPVTARVNDALQRIVTGAMGVAAAGTGAGMAAAAIGAAVNVAMSKTHVSRTGEMSGSTGLLDDFMPFLIIHRPMQSLAQNFKAQKGYPSNISAILSSLSGYTEVEYIHLTGISGATDTELAEIEQLLKNGVII